MNGRRKRGVKMAPARTARGAFLYGWRCGMRTANERRIMVAATMVGSADSGRCFQRGADQCSAERLNASIGGRRHRAWRHSTYLALASRLFAARTRCDASATAS
jgi:hypothetical protein